MQDAGQGVDPRTISRPPSLGSVAGFAVVLAALSTAVSPWARAGESPARLVADDPIYDWGVAFQGQEFLHTFRLTNKGSVALTIAEVKPSCGCTVARQEIRDRKLAPGESIDIEIKVETAKFAAYTRLDVDIVCAGAVTGDLKLWTQGDVKPLLAIVPTPLLLEAVRDPQILKAAKLEVALNAAIDRPVRLRGLKPQKKLLSAELTEVEPGRSYRAVLRPLLDAKQRVAFHTEVLEAEVEVDGHKLTLPIDVDIRLKDRVDVTPSKSIWFSRNETSQLLAKDAPLPAKLLEVVSVAGPEHRFKVTRVTVESGAFKAAMVTIDEGRRYGLRVELLRPAGPKRGRVQDKVIVETDDPDVPRIVIPGSALF